MEHGALWPFATLALLGAFHGINPGMGWLFAVALGLQEQRRRAVWRAMLPLTLGHALAIGGALAVALAVGVVVPLEPVRWVVGALLVGLGVLRLMRHRHPRFGGMRVGLVGLTVWSFLMATAHGAGLMVLPVVLASATPASATETEGGLAGDSARATVAAPHCHATVVGEGALRSDRDALGGLRGAIAATAVHGAGYLVVTALLAWVVFEKVGVGILRRAWLNLDQVWALALIATGALTALL
jgi:hypothetical protein